MAIHWMTSNAAPRSVFGVRLYCGCKKGCSSQRCSCKAGLRCTDLCKCQIAHQMTKKICMMNQHRNTWNWWCLKLLILWNKSYNVFPNVNQTFIRTGAFSVTVSSTVSTVTVYVLNKKVECCIDSVLDLSKKKDGELPRFWATTY